MVNPTTVPVDRSSWRLRSLPTGAEWRLLYAVTSIPIHIWAVLMFFYSLPAYLMRMSVWNMLSILAYVLSLALIESLLIAAVLTVVAVLLPARFFRQYFVPQGVLVVLLLTLWMIPVHFYLVDPGQQALSTSLAPFLPAAWIISLVLALVGLSVLLRRRAGFARLLTGIAERFTLLAGVYVMIDIVCLVAVIIRLIL